MSYPNALGQTFRDFCLEHGYVYQRRASSKAFFRSFTSGEWVRKSLAVAPLEPHREFPHDGVHRQTAVTVTLDSYTVLAKRTRHYKTFGHLIQDIVAGNWVRATKHEGAA